MSYKPYNKPVCEERTGAVEMVIRSVEKDLGDMTVRRVLPSAQRAAVGPFVFFDHMGPARFPPGAGISVRPHPHIGIATITYLFEGEIFHRDSLGFAQPVLPGAVNLMTAGRGIVHSERAGSDLNSQATLHGIQSWMALPDEFEECAPDFVHYAANTIPEVTVGDVTVRVIVGSAFGSSSPVTSYSPMLYLEARMPRGSDLTVPRAYPDLALYVVSGEVRVDSCTFKEGEMLLVAPDKTLHISAGSDSRIMIIGGESVGRRHLWWNFVSSSQERIENAKREWASGGFHRIVDDQEFIPLPEEKILN